jgi:nicotinic acid mononucleotide adenylyltransferase
VFLAKYYTQTGGIRQAMKALFDHNTQLWVGSRSQETYPPLQDLASAPLVQQYLQQIHKISLALPISASAVRQAIANKDPVWTQWVSPEVSRYIKKKEIFG